MKPFLYLVRGLPGSGKTTLGQKLVDTLASVTTPTVLVEADQFFVTSNGHKEIYNFDRRFLGAAHDECYGRAMRYLRSGHTVIVANTFSTEREVNRYRAGVERTGLDVDIKVIRCTGTFKSPHGVPARAIHKMAERWEPIEGETVYEHWRTDDE